MQLVRLRRAVVLAVVLAVPAPAAAAPDPRADEIVQQVRHDGRTLTMRLTKVALRGPHFELRVQQSDGSYAAPAPPIGERAYLGTVDGRPAAVAAAIVTTDGHVRGQIVFNRGATWFTRDSAITATRGTEPPVYAWPTRPTVASRLAGTRTRAWDLAVDTDSEYVARLGSSLPAVLDQIEYAISNVRAIYLHDALLMPRLARIVIRAAPGRDPYTGTTTFLGQLRDEWRAHQADAVRDEVVLAAGGGGSGGVAYKTNLDPDLAYANAGADADGSFDIVARHEIGHNFGLGDLHAGSPEGKTIIEGNQYARFGGPELQTLFTSRDQRRGIYDDLGPFTRVPLAPYAGLDLLDNVAPSAAVARNVVANDHDANGQAVHLVSVDARTAAGGSAEPVGGQVVYHAPAQPTALDTVQYTIADTCGQTATGVVFARTGGASHASDPRPRLRPTLVLDRGGPSCAGLSSGEVAKVPLAGLIGSALRARVRIRAAPVADRAALRVWRCGVIRPERATLTVGKGRTGRVELSVRLRSSRRLCVATSSGVRVRVDVLAAG